MQVVGAEQSDEHAGLRALQRGGRGVIWTFYDRDNDGSFDWVLFSLDGQRVRATLGYAISGTTATLQPSAAGTAMISAQVFTNEKLRAEFPTAIGSL